MQNKDIVDMVQLSLFSDEDTKVNSACKKIEKNMRDIALDLKNNVCISGKCVYNLSQNVNETVCQIEKMQKRQVGVRVPPCYEKCGTSDCIYYTKSNK